MSVIYDGGPAFPGAELPERPRFPVGISVRDWFASHALMGCLAYSHYNENTWGDYHNNGTFKDLAVRAYDYADAMLEARKNRGEQ